MSHPQLQRIAEEWRRNRRLRLGALAILLILGAHAALTLSDARKARVEAYRRDAALLGRLEEASRESAWPARAKAAADLLASERHSIPAARSDGLAQAEMQAWLTDLAAYAGLTDTNVRVETSLAVPGQDGLWQVLARLDGNASPAALPVLVRALTSAMPWIRAERFEIQGGDRTRVSMVVRGFYRPAEPADATTPPPRPADLPSAPPPPVTLPAETAGNAAAGNAAATGAAPANARRTGSRRPADGATRTGGRTNRQPPARMGGSRP